MPQEPMANGVAGHAGLDLPDRRCKFLILLFAAPTQFMCSWGGARCMFDIVLHTEKCSQECKIYRSSLDTIYSGLGNSTALSSFFISIPMRNMN